MKMKKFMVAALATAMTVGSVMTASAAWVQEGANWKFQNDNGTYQANTWFRDGNGKWYHFDGAANMQKGWFQDVDGKWYFLDFSGSMVTGLIKVDDNVYFMDEHGAMFIGDKAINGVTYNFGLNGTTNGKPAVPTTGVYGGNGNQSLSGGGGSSSGRTSGGGGSSSNKTQLKSVDSAEKLNELANDGYTNLKYETKAAGSVTLTETGEADYSKISLKVDAPNQSITNEVSFKSVTIDAIKENTWYEKAEKNNITLNSNARIVNDGGNTSVNVAKAKIEVKLEGSEIKLNISEKGAVVTSDAPIIATVSEETTLIVNNTQGSSVTVTKPVTVDVKSANPADAGQLAITTTAKATIKTAIPVEITASEAINLTITNSAAARGSTITAANEEADKTVGETVIKNESASEVVVEVKKSDDSVVPTEPVESKVTVEELVEEGIAAAVVKADGSSYINAALSKDENVVTVTIKKEGEKLINALPTARTIFNIFKSVDGVETVIVGGNVINNDDEMISAARELGFSGNTELKNVKDKTYSVTVEYKDGDTTATLEYEVVIK